jgi:hypothetical protein
LQINIHAPRGDPSRSKGVNVLDLVPFIRQDKEKGVGVVQVIVPPFRAVVPRKQQSVAALFHEALAGEDFMGWHLHEKFHYAAG